MEYANFDSVKKMNNYNGRLGFAATKISYDKCVRFCINGVCKYDIEEEKMQQMQMSSMQLN